MGDVYILLDKHDKCLYANSMFTLDKSLGFLVNTVAYAMRRELEARLLPYSLTAPQWAVLARLWEEDKLSMSELGKRLHLDKPTITGVADRLEKKGLIKRYRQERDRRLILIHLTPEGVKLKEALAGLPIKVNEKAAQGLTKKERQVLIKALKQMRDNLK